LACCEIAQGKLLSQEPALLQKGKMNLKGKIYVTCPAYYATGGTELLHQLVYKLRNVYQVDAWIYYYNIDWKFEVPPTPKRLKKYIDEFWVEEIPDDSSHILIIPEVLYHLAFKLRKIRKVLWWLSVDNFFLALGVNYQERSGYQRIKDSIKKRIKRYPYDLIFKLCDPSVISLHFVQSYYAHDFLQQLKVANIHYLSDYINLEFVPAGNNSIRQNRVLYNPLKGELFTKQLMAAAPDFTWVPIEKMQPNEIAALMSASKVYIDFGNHPGKDRIPREAAINGCCIITCKKGAAKNEIDIPIPSHYKYEDGRQNIQPILNKIRFCLEHYEEASQDFVKYKKVILNEERKFEQDLQQALALLVQ
jgi:hypothetical protein